MRGVFMLAFCGCVVVLCRATSEPIVGSGSGDVMIISRTNSTLPPPTDSTNDSGSGVDDEDDEDYTSSGSALPTTESTTQQVTTELTTKATTPTTATLQIATTSDDDEDISSASGSGSGEVEVIFKTPSSESTTASTDIYIESTTDTVAKVESTTADSKINIKTRPQPTGFPEKFNTASSTRAATTTKKPPSSPSTVKRTTIPTRKSVETTTAATEKTSKWPSVTEDSAITSGPKTTEANPRFTEEETTQRTAHKTTKAPSGEGNVAARKGSKNEGFTLTTEVIAGVVGCALLALLLIAFLMYRLKKRDEGSYLLDESNGYADDYKKVHVSDKEAFI